MKLNLNQAIILCVILTLCFINASITESVKVGITSFASMFFWMWIGKIFWKKKGA